MLDLGVPGILLVGFWKLWSHFNAKDREHQLEKAAWATEKQELVVAHQAAVSALKAKHEEALDKVWEEARKDKSEQRVAFEDEKRQMRTIYTDEIKGLQAKHEQEQVDRREEAERLLREQNVLTREVMDTAQAMSRSLHENSRVVEKLDQSLKGGA